MKITISILIIFMFILVINFIMYRRQIKKICRQMSFIEKNDTNMLITTDIAYREILELTEHINQMNNNTKTQINQYKVRNQQLKDEITNLSHDIRTPLTSLDGYFQLLQESVSEEERSRYIQIINGRIENLRNLLEELFIYAKLQNDTYELELTKENVTQIVCESVFTFYEDFKLMHIEPIIHFQEDAIWLMCNKVAFGRVIHNIVKNALVHGTKKLELVMEQRGEQFVFICKNEVENPDEIVVNQVFERFYKADSSRNKNSTGLGLAIAKEMVHKMNGKITAELEGNDFSIIITMRI